MWEELPVGLVGKVRLGEQVDKMGFGSPEQTHMNVGRSLGPGEDAPVRRTRGPSHEAESASRSSHLCSLSGSSS
jgi:hypothetical protein